MELTTENKSRMIRRLIEHYCRGNKSKFATMLGISPQNLSQWLGRGTYDPHILYARCERVNPAWLLSGEGDMILPEQSPQATANGDNSVATAALNSKVEVNNFNCKDLVSSLNALIEEKEKRIKEKDEYLEEKSRRINEKDYFIQILIQELPPEVRQKWDKIAHKL